MEPANAPRSRVKVKGILKEGVTPQGTISLSAKLEEAASRARAQKRWRDAWNVHRVTHGNKWFHWLVDCIPQQPKDDIWGKVLDGLMHANPAPSLEEWVGRDVPTVNVKPPLLRDRHQGSSRLTKKQYEEAVNAPTPEDRWCRSPPPRYHDLRHAHSQIPTHGPGRILRHARHQPRS